MTPDLWLSDKQIDAIDILNSHNGISELLFGGAKNGGKSFLGATWELGDALVYPGTFYFIARRELVDLKKFTTPTIFEWFKVNNIDFSKRCVFNERDSIFHFRNGSKLFLLACNHLPSDPLYERFGSMQMTRGWIEEGGEIAFPAYENLKLSIGRWKNDVYNLPAKLLITCNPKKNWLYTTFYKPWKDGTLPADKAFIQSLVTDNYFRQSGAIKVLDSIRDPITRQRLRYGEWEYAEDPSALIDYDAIAALFTNDHVLATGQKYMAVDVARFGTDKSIIRIWHGLRCIYRDEMTKSSVVEVATRIKVLAADFNVPRPHIIIDEDGVGGGVLDLLSGAKGFIANSSPIYPKETEKYDNLKTQCAYRLADMVNNFKLHEATEDTTVIEKLTEELEQVKDKNVDNPKRSLIPKDKMKQVLGRSPDDLDTYIMRMYFELKWIETGDTVQVTSYANMVRQSSGKGNMIR